MPYANRRADRVAEAIREEVATALIGGAKDPRIVGFVTVTAVEVTADLRHAKVFVSVMGTDAERAQTLEGLDASAPEMRARLASALRLRHAPESAFQNDPSGERAARIDPLLAQVKDAAKPRDGDAH